MAKLTLSTFGSDYVSFSRLNSNVTAIQNAVENTLSRDGTGPNQMLSNLDMNSYSILNLPAPTSATMPLRLGDVVGGVVSANYTNLAGARSIYELLTANQIAVCQAGDNSQNLMTVVQAAMTGNPNSTWYWPAGHYFLDGNTALSLPQGIKWIGAGKGATTIKVGATPWGIEQLNPNGLTIVKGFSTDGISFLFSNNGIRLNSSTGGYDDTSGTQYYVMAPTFRECEFTFNNSASTKILLQLNKTFSAGVYNCLFSGGDIQLNVRGSDIFACRDSRFDNATTGAVLDEAFNPFGTCSLYDHNDMNNPKHYFVKTDQRFITVTNNHLETDFSPGSTGTGGNMQAMIDVIGSGSGAAFHTTIKNNIINSVFADYWLRYQSNNPYSLNVEDNHSPGVMPGVSFPNGYLPYFTNSATRMVCIHHGNSGTDPAFPFNYQERDSHSGLTRAAIFGAGRPGVNASVGLGAILNGVKCQSGAIYLPADANAAHYVEFSDWQGWPANVLKGSFPVELITYANIAGQVLNYEIYDGVTLKSSGTVTHTAANTMYITSIASAVFSTNIKIRLWNADTTRNGNAYLDSGAVLL